MAVPGVFWGTAGRDHAEGADGHGGRRLNRPLCLCRQLPPHQVMMSPTPFSSSKKKNPPLHHAATSQPRGWDGRNRREGVRLGPRPQRRSGTAPWEPTAPRGRDRSRVSTAACEASTSLTDCIKLLRKGSLFRWRSATSRNPVLISPSSCCK